MSAESIDLHMHSYYSDDGEYSPSELVEKCRICGIKVMSITDHNCVRGQDEGRAAALTAGITYIPGIEIDCVYKEKNLHVLGYGINHKSKDFTEIENNIEVQSVAASRKMVRVTQEMGFDVTELDMQEAAKDNYWKERWIPEMFAEVLLKKPEYADHPMLLPYRPGGERSDNPYVNFYWDYYSQGKAGYVKMEYPDLEKAVDIIHRNGGCAVLAHPGVNLKEREGLLEPIIATGIDGIEAFSSYHLREQCQLYYDAALRHRLFVTCGSDYHGKTKPAIFHGKHGGLIGEEEMRLQINRIADK